MTDTVQKFERVMYELKPRPVKVKAVSDLTPKYKRIVLEGEALADFESKSPADHIKFQIDVNGEPVRRDYTPRAYSATELTVDFALHGKGPLTSWARNAEVGSEATILGPRGSRVVHPVFDAYVMIGDETMLPAIGRALETLPAGVKTVAVIEVDGPEDELPLTTETDATIIWAHRNGRLPGEAMLESLAAIEWPTGEVYCYAGGEAAAMRGIRSHVLNDRGLEREHLNISGHWKRGESDFDHHTPIE